MGARRRSREVRIDGWRVEAIGGWIGAPAELVDNAVQQVVGAIRSGEERLYHRSRHALTYLTHVADGAGAPIEVYIKTYQRPRAMAALKRAMRGGRAVNVLRMTAALHRAGFSTPTLLLCGEHDGGRTMVVSARADGVALPDVIACLDQRGAPARKRSLLRALGLEVARLHRAGFVHGDLTPYNVFVVQDEAPRFIFLDHDRTRPAFPAGRRYRQLRNLVQLGRFDLPGLSNADRLRVLRAYAGTMGRVQWRATARRAARMLARRRQRDAN